MTQAGYCMRQFSNLKARQQSKGALRINLTFKYFISFKVNKLYFYKCWLYLIFYLGGFIKTSTTLINKSNMSFPFGLDFLI